MFLHFVRCDTRRDLSDAGEFLLRNDISGRGGSDDA
jgi:hypothetical protein